ncbi:MAG: hypothetical protein RR202_10620 [Bacteroidales bacterium]
MAKIKGTTFIRMKEEAEDSVLYYIVPSTNLIRYNSAGVTSTTAVEVSIYKKVGHGDAMKTKDLQILLHKYNGSSSSTVSYGYKDSITFQPTSNFDQYQIVAKLGSSVVSSATIQTVHDGPAGEAGQAYFPKGEWNATETYKKTTKIVEYATYLGYAYEPLKASVSGGVNPLADVTGGGGNWKSMGRHEVVAAKVILANYANIAGAVFWDDRLMSQLGVDNTGADSSKPQDYTENDDGEETGNFHPNLLLDWRRGALRFRGGFERPWRVIDNTISGVIDVSNESSLYIRSNTEAAFDIGRGKDGQTLRIMIQIDSAMRIDIGCVIDGAVTMFPVGGICYTENEANTLTCYELVYCRSLERPSQIIGLNRNGWVVLSRYQTHTEY